MKNPIIDKSLSLETLGMHYILLLTAKEKGSTTFTRKDIESTMLLKIGLDQKHDIQLTKLAKANYIRMENTDYGLLITLL